MVHLLAEAAEVRRHEEIAVDAGRRADRARVEEAADAARARRGSGGSGSPRGFGRRRARRGRSPRASSVLAASGFSVRTWQPWRSAVSDDAAARRRHADVEDDVGPGRSEQRRGRCRSRRRRGRTRRRARGRGRRRCRPGRPCRRRCARGLEPCPLIAPQPTSTARTTAILHPYRPFPAHPLLPTVAGRHPCVNPRRAPLDGRGLLSGGSWQKPSGQAKATSRHAGGILAGLHPDTGGTSRPNSWLAAGSCSAADPPTSPAQPVRDRSIVCAMIGEAVTSSRDRTTVTETAREFGMLIVPVHHVALMRLPDGALLSSVSAIVILLSVERRTIEPLVSDKGPDALPECQGDVDGDRLAIRRDRCPRATFRG